MAIVSGKIIKVGDIVTFKSDMEQQGEVIKIEGIRLHLQAISENGFKGRYLEGEDRISISCLECRLGEPIVFINAERKRVLSTKQLQAVKQYIKYRLTETGKCKFSLDKTRTILTVNLASNWLGTFKELQERVQHKQVESIFDITGKSFKCLFKPLIETGEDEDTEDNIESSTIN